MVVIRSTCPSAPAPTRLVHEEYLAALQRFGQDRPHQPCFVDYTTMRATFHREVYDASYGMAAFLHGVGLKKGDFVCTVLENGYEFLATHLGCGLVGAVLCGSNAHCMTYEIQHVFNLCTAQAVVCSAMALDQVMESNVIVLGAKTLPTLAGVRFHRLEDAFKTKPIPLPNADISMADIYMVNTSSGTTGPHKGVIGTHKSIGWALNRSNSFITENMAKRLDSNWNWRNEALVIQQAMCHGYGLLLTALSVLNGAVAVVVRSKEVKAVRLFYVFPNVMVEFTKDNSIDKALLQKVDVVIGSGGPMKPKLIREAQKLLPNARLIGQMFAMTETMLVSSMEVDYPEQDSVGGLLPNTELKIVDENERELEHHQVGQIFVRTPSSTVGYLNNQKATDEIMAPDGFIRTGDLGYLDEEGRLFVVDRCKEMIKVNGSQVAPAELEDLIMSSGKVADCAIAGLDDELYGEILHAVVVRKDQSMDEKEVLDLVNGKVLEYKRITGGVSFVDRIPRNINGKILRKQLKQSLTVN